MKKNNINRLIRHFLIELLLYGFVVVAYFFVILRYLGDWLSQLITKNIYFYAFLSLVLIVVQGALLDLVTTYLLKRLRLDRLE